MRHVSCFLQHDDHLTHPGSNPGDRHLASINDAIGPVKGGAAPLEVVAQQPQPLQPQPLPVGPSGVKQDAAAAEAHSDGHQHGADHHGLIGVALTLGFVVMFLVDQLGTGACCKACARPIFRLFCCCCNIRGNGDLILRELLFI